jgi:hypothetical protein
MSSPARNLPEASLGRRLEALVLTPVLVVATVGIGFLVWSAFEWRHSRTPSYHVLGLRVVRRRDGSPVGLWTSLIRSGLCCTVLVVPTIVIGAVVGVCFALGASPPDGLFNQPRAAPWDFLTATNVVDERAEAPVDVDPGVVIAELASGRDPQGMTGPRRNGHAP